MTEQEKIKIQELKAEFDKTKQLYEEELYQNTFAKNYTPQIAGGMRYWKMPFFNVTWYNESDFLAWLSASDASLKVKKENFEAAKLAYDQYTEEVSKRDRQQKAETEFFNKNPDVFASLQKAVLAQGTTKYLIWGTVALVIIIGAIVIIRKKYAA